MVSTVFAAAMVVVHALESLFGLRSWTMRHLDFTGTAMLQGHIHTACTSSFLHDSWSHCLKQVGLLLLVGGETERALGGAAVFAAAYLSCGALACVVSWRGFRVLPPAHLREVSERTLSAITDNSPSRGGSACSYALTVMATLVATNQRVLPALPLPWACLSFHVNYRIPVSEASVPSRFWSKFDDLPGWDGCHLRDYAPVLPRHP